MPALPIDSDRLAAFFTGHVQAVMPWVDRPDGSRGPSQNPAEQTRDEGERSTGTGLPLWTVFVLLMDGDRPDTVGVRVPSAECPRPDQMSPARFERLVATARVGRDGKLATYWSAVGLAAIPGRREKAEQVA